MEKPLKSEPVFWSGLILIACQILTHYVAFREKDFVESNQITPPQISLELPLIYFFGVVVLLGLILFLLPISKLRIVLKVVFSFLFCWGIFIVFGLSLPLLAASIIAIAGSLIWFFRPRVWLHNLLMILTLVSAGSVFGLLLSPWAAIVFMLVISVYDVLAVRFGYMLWLVKRLSESEILPAFVIPRAIPGWNLNLKKEGFKNLLEDKVAEREFSILGGGDLGFPLLLTASVFFTYGLASSLIVAAFSLLGLIAAYWIQRVFLKGKPMPALPPIFLMSLIGFLIAYFVY